MTEQFFVLCLIRFEHFYNFDISPSSSMLSSSLYRIGPSSSSSLCGIFSLSSLKFENCGWAPRLPPPKLKQEGLPFSACQNLLCYENNQRSTTILQLNNGNKGVPMLILVPTTQSDCNTPLHYFVSDSYLNLIRGIKGLLRLQEQKKNIIDRPF